MNASSPSLPWYRLLYVQVLVAVLLGILLGWAAPSWGSSLKPLADAFINLVKMMIGPIVFCTVVHGIASMGDLRRFGRLGFKTLLYFEVVSTLALLVGLVVVNLLRPGVGFHAELDPTQAARATQFAEKAKGHSTVDFLMNIIPTTFFSGFVQGEILQVLFVAILTAFALSAMGEKGQPILKGIERASELFFAVMGIVVRAAPLGAFGAMAFTIGKFGLESLGSLAYLMVGFYLTSILFVGLVLGSIAWMCGFSLSRFLWFIRDELLLVLGTSSSETALPGMMKKMTLLGCRPATVGMVIPTGYSFNLDGTNIYLTMAAVFLAQATGTDLSLVDQLGLLLVAMLTSKGASGVTGAGFVTLAATLAAVPSIPVESMAWIVGIDRFMSECRALTNLVGNGVATVVISRWEGEVTAAEVSRALDPRVSPPGPSGENQSARKP